MPDAATEAAPTKTPDVPRDPCLCGCGGTPTRKKSRFMPGHDAQMKAALYRTIRDDGVSVADKEAAAAKLTEFGWPQPAPKTTRKPKAQTATEGETVTA